MTIDVAAVRRLADEVRHSVTPLRFTHDFTASATLNTAQRYVRCDATAGAITITLPPAAALLGEMVWIKKVDGGANAVTVDADGAETIDGAATYAIPGGTRGSVTVRSTGTSWDIV